MVYPTIAEYKYAILNDPEVFKTLKLEPAIDNQGNIFQISGGYAVIFKMKEIVTGKFKAIKCFHKHKPDLIPSYLLISEHLKEYDSPYLIDFEFYEDEMWVNSEIANEKEFPIVVMEWVEGVTLKQFIKENIKNPKRSLLRNLSGSFDDLAIWLINQTFSHCDIKPENILINNHRQLKIVDYDDMFVPNMKGQNARIEGTPGYINPNRSIYDFDENNDIFSLVIISLSLRAIVINPEIYNKTFSEEHLVFTQNDIEDHYNSETFNYLWQISREIEGEFIGFHLSLMQILLYVDQEYVGEINTEVESRDEKNWKKRNTYIKDINVYFKNSYWKQQIFNTLNVTKAQSFIDTYSFKAKDQIRIFAYETSSFTKLISRHYSQIELLMGNIAQYLNWTEICSRTDIFWDIAKIEKYEQFIDWICFSSNPTIIFTEEIIEKYQEKLQWISSDYFGQSLSKSTNINWDEDLILKYIAKWDWAALSSNLSLPWSSQLFNMFFDHWDWSELSGNIHLHWSENFIDKYSDKLDWDSLGYNSSLPLNEHFIDKYYEKWNWQTLTVNKALPISIEFLEKYKKQLYWKDLSGHSQCATIPWSIELIEKFIDEWDWYQLSYNKHLPWSEDLIDYFIDYWKWSPENEFRITCLSFNYSINWSKDLIEKYKERWDWVILSSNTSIKWDVDLLKYFSDKIVYKDDSSSHFGGFEGDGMQLTKEIVLWCKDNIDLDILRLNYSFDWNLEVLEELVDLKSFEDLYYTGDKEFYYKDSYFSNGPKPPLPYLYYYYKDRGIINSSFLIIFKIYGEYITYEMVESVILYFKGKL
jgi:serine/threonine protein kinase